MIHIDPADYIGRYERTRKQEPRKPLPQPLRTATIILTWLFKPQLTPT